MPQSRRRLFISIVLVLAVIGFVGFSMIPLISTPVNQQPSTIATSSSQTPVAGQPPKLQEQARGYELVLQREPENQTALRGLVEARIQLRDLKGAIAPLEKLAALNPNQPQYTTLLAQAKQQLGDSEGAAQAYRSILQTKPGDLSALQGLSGLLLQQNRSQEAISLLQDTLRTAAQKNPTQPGDVEVNSVRLLLGQVYAAQKRDDEAIAIYDDLIKADKQDFRPPLAKAAILRKQGKTEQANSLFKQAAALAPAQYKAEIDKLAAPPPPAASPAPTVPK